MTKLLVTTWIPGQAITTSVIEFEHLQTAQKARDTINGQRCMGYHQIALLIT